MIDINSLKKNYKELQHMDSNDLFYIMFKGNTRRLAPIMFGKKDRKEFYKDLTSLLKAKLGFDEAIKEMVQFMPTKRVILLDIHKRLGAGRDPASAMEGWVPSEERMLLKAAERSGHIENVIAMLDILVSTLETSEKISKAILEAIGQPAMIFYSSLAIFVYISKSVIGKMVQSLHINVDMLQPSTRFYYEIFSFIGKPYGWTSVSILSVALPILAVFSVNKSFPGRRLLNNIPPWSIYRLVVGSGFLYSLSSMLKAGMNQKIALMEIKKQTTGWLRARVQSALSNLEKTGRISTALEADGYDFPDKKVIARLKLREMRGSLGEALEEFSNDWSTEGEETVKKQARILNTVAMIAVGVLTLFMATGLQAIQDAGTANILSPGIH